MGMSKENAEDIIIQLQQAHRISVAFYRRILPTLDMIADQLGCLFLAWEPLHTNRPGRRTSQPSKAWAWDYVPLFASSHAYRRTSGEKRTGPEEFGIKFDLYIEDSFTPEKRETDGQPDAISLPKGKSLLKVYLYRPKEAVAESFDVLWNEEGETEAEVGAWKSISKHWEGIAFEWPLADVIHDTQPMIKVLQEQIKNNANLGS